MASATVTTKRELTLRERLRGLWSSRIARLIFVWNLVGLAVLALGFLLLTELRAQLVRAQLEALRTQGELIRHVLVQVATTEGDPEPGIDEQTARAVLAALLPPRDPADPGLEAAPRVRLIAPDGRTIADTYQIDATITTSPLPDITAAEEPGLVRRVMEAVAAAGRSAETLRLTPWRPDMTFEEERARAADAGFAQGQRLGDLGERVISVSLPIRRVEANLGVVTIETAGVERYLLAERLALTPFILGAGLVTLLSSALLALLIARPLRALAGAADRLRLTGGTRLDLGDLRRRRDEIGDLAQALERMTGTLGDRIDMTERFAADVAHELKNPLTSIRSATETVQRVQDPADRAKLMGVIAADVSRLDRLITDISRATRLEAETARGANEVVDLGRMVADIAETYAQLRQPGHPAVTFRGPPPADAVLLGQAGPLGQVFRNLIDNALGFSPPDGVVTVSASLERRKEGRFVRAMVEDQGPGVPPSALTAIFERFYTDRPTGTAFGGNSGLGLSIARAIVEQHGGRIWAENIGGDEAPLGARLVVELPAAPAGWD